MHKAQPARPTSRIEVMPATMDLMPIEFSHRVVMSCIEEIKLRGLRHPHLFRNVFHAPSVESALSMLANPRKHHLFSVKMMRIDTVAGLLTTALSRTFPPLIPQHIQDKFQNPNGRFFFELLGMLPELNRYLFVEILDLCCSLVDNQSFNQISHSKLAVFPGSCCFGLNEYKPNWDTRFLMSADLRRFSSAFYHAIYAYREERDLTEEELQQKLDTRERILEQERFDALERVHGYRGAQAIVRMEARIAQGLPAESPTKEISLYADRQEKVVADDAISVLNMSLDDDDPSAVPDLDCVQEEDEDNITDEPEDEPEENVELVLRDLRKSRSVASLGGAFRQETPSRMTFASLAAAAATHSKGPSPSPSTSPDPRLGDDPSAEFTPGALSRSNTLHALSRSNTLHALSRSKTLHGVSRSNTVSGLLRSNTSGGLSRSNTLSGLSRSNTISRFGSTSLRSHPVSPGDLLGISDRALESLEIQAFMGIVQSIKRQKSSVKARALCHPRYRKSRSRTRLASQLALLLEGVNGNETRVQTPLQQAHALSILRLERARRILETIEAYQVKESLSIRGAIQARDMDLKKKKLRLKRAQDAALALQAERERQVEREREAAIALQAAGLEELAMEEAEVLEAFDYLTDEEFQEFMDFAGLTTEDVDKIRAKAAAISLSKVTRDIQEVAQESAVTLDSTLCTNEDENRMDEEEKRDGQEDERFEEANMSSTEPHTENRPFKIPHMTSMDMLFKNANLIGDANLRCYPTRPSSPTDSDFDYESESIHGGLLSRAASVMTRRYPTERDEETDEESEEQAVVERIKDLKEAPAKSMVSITKSVAYELSKQDEESWMETATPIQQVNNHHHRLTLFAQAQVLTQEESVSQPTAPHHAFQFETVEYEEHLSEPEAIVNEEDEDEAELRELLESMSEEERAEFLRLSRQESQVMPEMKHTLVHL